MNENEKVPSLIPVLTVEDVEKAAAFYKQLGFSEVFSIPDQKRQLVHAHLRKGDSVLFLGRLGLAAPQAWSKPQAIGRMVQTERLNPWMSS